MVYLPTFPIETNQMQVNIPYMDGMGMRFSTPSEKSAKWQVNSVNLCTQLFHPMTPEVIDGDVTTFFFRQDLPIRFY